MVSWNTEVVSKDFVMRHQKYQDLKREIEIQYRLHHKHIAQLMGYFHDDFNVYLVLHHYVNGDLLSYLKKQTITEPEIGR